MQQGWKRTRHTLLWYVQITLGLLWLLPLNPSQGSDIVILKSHDLEPFNQAMAGFVAACPVHITEYDLRGTKKRKVALSSVSPPPNRASSWLLVPGRRSPENTCGMSHDLCHGFQSAHTWSQGANLAGVSLDIPVQTH